jgi:adenine-specific DNA-methyltransferase
MEKLKMESANLTEQNIDKIAALFPSAITETKDADGNLKKAINFNTLKQLLSEDIVEGDECYEFTWVGKKQSIIDANRPIRKTLRPCPEESKNWDKTQNMYIEGDNLEVLKLLQGSYLNSIKMIYIDPPYNTGKDFLYKDNFSVSKNDYNEDKNLIDEDGNRLYLNPESNGRFHSDWCNLIYPRLQLAQNLLTDDGIILISIDDNEVKNLRNICEEVFGEENFIAQFIWFYEGVNDNQEAIKKTHEYVLLFAKNKKSFNTNNSLKDINVDLGESIENSLVKNGRANPPSTIVLPAGFPCEIKQGIIKKTDIKSIEYSDDVVVENYKLVNSVGVTSGWSSKKILETYIQSDFAAVRDTKNQLTRFEIKSSGNINYIKDRDQSYIISVLRNYGTTQSASNLLKELGLDNFFPFPKPIGLIKYLLGITLTDNSYILDFFSGSSSTAHAVMQLNAEDGGNRKFIMVQLPEACDKESEAFKAGYSTICEIGKERIRRSANKIIKENPQKIDSLDTGFRVMKLDSTNMKDIYYSAGEYNQQMLLDLESNIKDDRTDLDLLYGVLLDWGVSLSLPHTTEAIEGVKVHFVNGVDLVACFAEEVTETVILEIAKRKPLRVVFRDSSFANSPDKINVTEIFKTISSETTVKVI